MKYLTIGFLQFILLQTFLLGQYFDSIHTLNTGDPTFKELIHDIMENQKLISNGHPPLSLKIFTYTPKTSDTLYTISARLNLPYDTIATLNNLSSPILFSQKKSVYIPNMVGLVIRHDIHDPFLKELEKNLQNQKNIEFLLPDISSNSKKIPARFYPNQRFNSSTRTNFLMGFFIPPLHSTNSFITSGFGKRNSPTKKGKWELHTGVDYRAPLYTKVHVSRFGTIKEIGIDKILGLYILVQHEENLQTLYGHLSSSFVKKGDKVLSGEVIGKTGNTGRTTGPHLHFEIRKKGEPINPIQFLKR